MLIDFTIKGTYISHEEDDPEIAVAGLTPEILIAAGQVNGLDLDIGTTSWWFDYTNHALHIKKGG